MSETPLPSTPQPKPSSFRPKTPRSPLPPIAPFDPSHATKPRPAGHYLLLRGVETDGTKTASDVVSEAVHTIRQLPDLASLPDFATTDLAIHNTPRNKPTASVTIRLTDATPMEDGEPRVDILQDWLDAFSQYNREWEVVWAPQNEKDKRLWVRVQDVFKDDRKDKTEDDKVISSIRKVIETSIGLTTDGFRMGLHAIIILQFPAHADFLIRTGVLNVRAIEYRIVRVRQIEVQAAFEIVVGGFKRGYNDESDARAVCDSWFNSIVNSNGESMLVGVRTDDEEPDFVIYSLSSWATTAYVLSEEMSSNFARQLGSVYGLTTPTLLYAHNSRAVYRKDVGAIIADGAKQVDAGFVALTKRMDKFEREARERDVVNKTQMKHLSDSVTSLTAATALISSQQQDLSRGMYIMGKEMDYTNRLTRLDIDLSLARRTMANPIDDNEKDEAKKEIRDLNAQRIVLKKELDALRGDPILAIAPGPVVSPPPAPAPVAAANIGPSSPRKRPRTSTDGPDPNNSEDDVAQQVLGADVDVSMQPVPESTAS